MQENWAVCSVEPLDDVLMSHAYMWLCSFQHKSQLKLQISLLMQGQGRRNTMFGVDFQEQVERYRTQVPPIITKCLAEIERRGVMIKVSSLGSDCVLWVFYF